MLEAALCRAVTATGPPPRVDCCALFGTVGCVLNNFAAVCSACLRAVQGAAGGCAWQWLGRAWPVCSVRATHFTSDLSHKHLHTSTEQLKALVKKSWSSTQHHHTLSDFFAKKPQEVPSHTVGL